MLSQLLDLLESNAVPWRAWAVAWARVLPTAVLLPALGARFLPAQVRTVLGLSLALLLVPAVSETAPSDAWLLACFQGLFHGLPVAVSASVLLWAASQAGGLVDDVRGASAAQEQVLTDAQTPLATLLGLFASMAFLQLGGVEAVVLDLAQPTSSGWQTVVSHLNYGLAIAYALAVPCIVVAWVIDVASALVARAASPASVTSLTGPLRSLVVLGAFAVVFPRLTQALGGLLQ